MYSQNMCIQNKINLHEIFRYICKSRYSTTEKPDQDVQVHS